ncbi:MAG: hypothetical protein NTX72_04735 [Candidatus Uhrbacteria bacterium]|nr:hypothetical protein [Candidatus Uhrbacteria bacterium]
MSNNQDPLRFPGDESGSPTGQAIVQAIEKRLAASGMPAVDDANCLIVACGDTEIPVILDLGSGVTDLSEAFLCGLPPYDPSLTCEQDPKTGEIVVFKDGKEIRREVSELAPPLPWTPELQRLHEAMVAENLHPSACYDFVRDGHFGYPSTFKGSDVPPKHVTVEHYCPPDDK